jgi:hypothetical protein
LYVAAGTIASGRYLRAVIGRGATAHCAAPAAFSWFTAEAPQLQYYFPSPVCQRRWNRRWK